MISLKKSIHEFDRKRRLERTALESYCSVIQSAEAYLVEVDPADASDTRSHLREVHSAAKAGADADALPAVLEDTRSHFRALLRDYQERAHTGIRRLRANLDSAAAAMQHVADAMAAQDGGHRDQLQHELVRLKATTRLNEVSEIRAGVLTAVDGIEACVERMQQENQLVIAQLSDEIRVLHDRVDAASKLATLDPATGLLNRTQTESLIALAASPETTHPLCLIYIAVRNYKLLCHHSGRQVAEAAMVALAGRIRGIFGAAQAGRWSDDEVLVLLFCDPSHSLSLSKKAAAETPGSYPVQISGRFRNATLHTQVLFLERRTAETAREILRRIDDFALGVPNPPTIRANNW